MSKATIENGCVLRTKYGHYVRRDAVTGRRDGNTLSVLDAGLWTAAEADVVSRQGDVRIAAVDVLGLNNPHAVGSALVAWAREQAGAETLS